MIKKVAAGLNLVCVLFYWLPEFGKSVQNYTHGEFLAGLDLVAILFSANFILLGVFGIVGLLKTIRLWMVQLTFSVLAIKQIIDMVLLDYMFSLVLLGIFLLAAVLSPFLRKFISPEKQTLVMNALALATNAVIWIWMSV